MNAIYKDRNPSNVFNSNSGGVKISEDNSGGESLKELNISGESLRQLDKTLFIHLNGH